MTANDLGREAFAYALDETANAAVPAREDWRAGLDQLDEPDEAIALHDLEGFQAGWRELHDTVLRRRGSILVANQEVLQ